MITSKNHLGLISLIAAMTLLLSSGASFAAGTAASTTISNTATVNYDVGGVPASASDTVAFVVDEVLDISLVWQDAANVAVASPDTAQVLTFLLTNLGNGSEQFLLNVNTALGGDDFDPVPASAEIWIDTDGNGVLSTILDTLYTGANGPILDGADAANDAINIFVLADIPAGRSNSDLANVQLTATSVAVNTAGEVGNPGAEISGAGDGGVNAHVGLSGGEDAANGTYEVSSAGVSINKSVSVVGGGAPIPGAILRYTLTVTLSGGANIDNLVITDPVPTDTTYIADSIVLNAAAQTDAADAPGTDYSDFNSSNADSITVDLSQGGTLSIAPPLSFTITFDTRIN
ncbi:MAG TPA: hypothetical protein VGL10_04320 [Gammaproteobacteria bacterium]